MDEDNNSRTETGTQHDTKEQTKNINTEENWKGKQPSHTQTQFEIDLFSELFCSYFN